MKLFLRAGVAACALALSACGTTGGGTAGSGSVAALPAPTAAVAPQAAVAPSPEQVAKAQAKAAKEAERAAKKAQQARLAGAYEPDVAQFVSSKPATLQPHYRALFVEGERNAVLNLNRIGLLELEAGNIARAKWAFDKAIGRINAIYASDEKAKAARSLWSEEAVKDFKGEPYERAMSFYYRGLIDLMEGDFQNARASFKEGEYQDTLSEAEQFEGDFAVLNFLSGWASQCDGDRPLGEEYFGFAKTAQPTLVSPEPDHNLLVIGEGGRSPYKERGGKYGEYLVLKAGEPRSETGVAVDGPTPLEVKLVQATDLSFQATTRGGKPFQAVLDGKAEFKSISGTVGNVATGAGLGLMAAGAYGNNNDAAIAGAAVALFGLLAKAASEASKPAADIRYWDTLPGSIDVGTGKAPLEAVSVRVKNAGGEEVVRITGQGRCRVAWIRPTSALPLAPSAPNTVLQGRLSKAMLAKDAAFRAELLNDDPVTDAQTQGAPTS